MKKIIIIGVIVVVAACGVYLYVAKTPAQQTTESSVQSQIENGAPVESDSKYITLLSPNNGEVMDIGKTYEIRWKLKDKGVDVKKINITATKEVVMKDVSANDVISVAVLSGADVAKGTYSWTIPSSATASDKYRFSISISDETFLRKIWKEFPKDIDSYGDASDGYITIK